MSKKKFLFFLTFFLFCSISFFAKDKHFKRIEEYPSGEQTKSLIGSFFSGTKDVNAVEHTFDAALYKVWPVLKSVANKFAKISGRLVVGIDEANNLIQNGNITQDSMIGSGSGAWMDQIQMKAISTENQTKVIVSRKVVQREFTGKREWKTQLSNGKIESYLLTQIEDELNNSDSTQNLDNISINNSNIGKITPGKYFQKDNKIYCIELKPDGTFITQEREIVGYTGTYNITNNELTCIISNSNLGLKFTINGDTLTTNDGKTYIKANNDSQENKSAETLTNEDIVKMVKAKLSNKIIIAKIHKAECKFDTTTDVLIKLKQSGVNDEIIQVMTEVDSQ